MNSLGEEHMLSLILNNSVFLHVENDFYTQLTGFSISFPFLTMQARP
jgi:hypothetical protein